MGIIYRRGSPGLHLMVPATAHGVSGLVRTVCNTEQSQLPTPESGPPGVVVFCLGFWGLGFGTSLAVSYCCCKEQLHAEA